MNVVQFTNLDDFINDLAESETAAVYHELIEQRISHTDYGMSRWQIMTVIRAIAANGRISHSAALTFPHGEPVTFVNGQVFGPPHEDRAERWDDARTEYNRLVELVTNQLARLGLANIIRPGILHVPEDLPLVFADPFAVVTQEVLGAAVG